MSVFFGFFILFFTLYSFLALKSFNNKILTPVTSNLPEYLEIKERIDNIYKFFGINVIPLLIFSMLSASGVYFINREIFYPFIYGIVIFLFFIFINLITNYFLSFHFYPQLKNEQNIDEAKNIFLSVKYLFFVLILYFLFSLFTRLFDKIDYIIIFCGSSFMAFCFYLSSYKNEKIYSFILNSIFSFSVVILFVFFMRFSYLNFFKPVCFLSVIYFALKLLWFYIKKRLNLKYDVLNESGFVGVFIIFSFFTFLKYFNNLIFLPAYVLLFFALYSFLRLKIYGFIKFFSIFLFLFIAKYLSFLVVKFSVDFSFSSAFLFLLSLNIIVVYDYLKEIEFDNLLKFNKTLSEKEIKFNESDIKIPFAFISLSFYPAFISIYDVMKKYYGYSDSVDVMVGLVSVLIFYFYESYIDDILKKMDNLILHFVFNISIAIFVFSFSIVFVSYFSEINFSNLAFIYMLYSFLVLAFSKKIYNHIVSIFYLSFFYILLYVRS